MKNTFLDVFILNSFYDVFYHVNSLQSVHMMMPGNSRDIYS